MDNPNFCMSSDDIDERLARYDEQVCEEDKNNCEEQMDQNYCSDSGRISFDEKKGKCNTLSEDNFTSNENKFGKKIYDIEYDKELYVHRLKSSEGKLIEHRFVDNSHNFPHKTASDFSRTLQAENHCQAPSLSKSYISPEYSASACYDFAEFSSKQKDTKQDVMCTDFSRHSVYDKAHPKNKHYFPQENSSYKSKGHEAKQDYQGALSLCRYDMKSEPQSNQNIDFKKDSACEHIMHVSRYSNTCVKSFPEKNIFPDVALKKSKCRRDSGPESISSREKMKQQFRHSEYLNDSDEENERFLHSKARKNHNSPRNSVSQQMSSVNSKFAIDYESDDEEYFNPYLGCKQKWLPKNNPSLRSSSQQNDGPKLKVYEDTENKMEKVSQLHLKRRANDLQNVSLSKDLTSRITSESPKSDLKYFLSGDHSEIEKEAIRKSKYNIRNVNSKSKSMNHDIGSKKNMESCAQSEIRDSIWIRRQNVCDEEACTSFSNDILENNVNSQRTLNANTFTMHDARRIAPFFIKSAENENEETSSDILNAVESECFGTKRQCWSRICWSTTIHSHASLNNSMQSFSRKQRNAILKSMRTHQYAAVSTKRKCSDYLTSFVKEVSPRFQLWNRTLKKIEGQFGTGVVSYFVFLRWLILLNFVIFILYLLLIVVPYSAFSVLPQRKMSIAPNTTLFTKEYLEHFPKYESVQFTRKKADFGNISVNLGGDLLANLDTLLHNYAPEEILDATLRYDKRNFTEEERLEISHSCEKKYKEAMNNRTTETLSFLQDFLQGTGWLQSTILFIGSYPARDVSFFGLPFNLPVSYLAALIVSCFLSVALMMQFSSDGIQENILSRKSNFLTFSNILFCSWDYCIEDKKTADIRHKSIVCEIKSNLAEEQRKAEVKQWSSQKKMTVCAVRTTIFFIVIFSLCGCFYLIYKVVNFQLKKQRENALQDAGAYTLFIQFLPPLAITGLNIVMPIIFYNLVKLEMYDTRQQVKMALWRIVFLRLASVFVLVSSLYQQITCEPKDECKAGLNEYCRTPMCWETFVGQQLYKLVITDFLVYIFMFLAYDLPRDFIVRNCKCKVTEVIGRQVFDLPSQVLSLVYSQTLCWLGIFYSPLLSGITVLKFFIVFYVKKVVVLDHCIPAPVLYKASRSNSIFMMILMISFFFVTIIHGYSLTSIEPSPGCSPFRLYYVMVKAVPDAINDWSPTFVKFLSFLFSGFFYIPAYFLLSLLIYYYWTVQVAHKKMTKVLKAQIAVEGRDKQFLLNRLAEAARQATSN